LTELDLLAPLPDPSLLLGNGFDLDRGLENVTLNWGTQNVLNDSVDQSKPNSVPRALDDEDLELDLGDDADFTTALDIETGRDGQAITWRDEFGGDASKLLDDDLDLDLGNDALPLHLDDDLGPIGGDLDMTDALGLDDTITAAGARPWPTGSPLSELRPSAERDLDSTFRIGNETSLFEPPEEESIHEAQRIKRRKILQQDADTELHTAQIKAQQEDRSKILKPASFLPRDPMLLALLNMQKNGGFISSILGDGRTLGWAPELRDIISVEIVRRSGDLKRKRDSGVSDMYLDEERGDPSLHIPDDDDPTGLGAADFGEDSFNPEGLEVLPSEGARGQSLLGDHGRGDLADDEAMSPPPDFDDTTMPLLHPADAGPISQGTRHAVHLLRDHFGPDGENSPSQRQKTSVLLQDLLPERTTSRRDATKMFFEVLVLATKDAVKVEQKPDNLGGPIRLRAKRGLWGAWAEESTSNQEEEAAEEEAQEQATAGA
jgi:cohesin complex subunit SCC1